MKRIQSACLLQTIQFLAKEDTARSIAQREIEAEVEHYEAQLQRNRTKYRVIERTVQPDGSVILKIRKQYNGYDCGDYLET